MTGSSQRNDSAQENLHEPLPSLRETDSVEESEEGEERVPTSPVDHPSSAHDLVKPSRARWFRTYPLFSTAVLITVTLIGLYIYSSPRNSPPRMDFKPDLYSGEFGDREVRLRLRLAFAQVMHNNALIRRTLEQLAQVAYTNGERSRAIRLLEESQAPSQDRQTPIELNDWTMRALSELYLQTGRNKEALALLKRWKAALIKNGNEVSGSLFDFHTCAEWIYLQTGDLKSANREEQLANWSRLTPNSVYINPDGEAPDERSDAGRLCKGCWLFTHQKYREALAQFDKIDIANLDQEQQHDLPVIGAITESFLFRDGHYPTMTPLPAHTSFFETEYNRRRSIVSDEQAPQIVWTTEPDIFLCDLCAGEARARHDHEAEPHFRHLAVDARSRYNQLRDAHQPRLD